MEVMSYPKLDQTSMPDLFCVLLRRNLEGEAIGQATRSSQCGTELLSAHPCQCIDSQAACTTTLDIVQAPQEARGTKMAEAVAQASQANGLDTVATAATASAAGKAAASSTASTDSLRKLAEAAAAIGSVILQPSFLGSHLTCKAAR